MNYLLKLVIVVPRCKDCGEVEEEDAVQEKRGNVDRCKINQYAVDAIGSHLLPIKSLSGADKECLPGAGLNGYNKG